MNEIINNSKYLAYKFDFNTESVEFLPVETAEIRKVTWLRKEAFGSGRRTVAVPLSQLVGLLDSCGHSLSENPPRFIFHTAYCSSTFMSRCLDVAGVTLSLREPQLLLDAANAKRLAWRSKSTQLDYRHLPKLALALLSKHAGPGEKLVIKPINSVNNIIPELLQITGSGRSLMLYTDARNFLLSTLKKGEEAKQTIRAMFDLLRCDFQHLSKLRLTDVIHMSDLKLILTFWRLQIEQADQALKISASSNLMASLYSERLNDRPLETLQAANRFLELGISAEQLDGIAKSDVRFNDAKNIGEPFSVEKREEIYRKLERFYGADLDNGFRWMTRNNPATSLCPELRGALKLKS